MSRRGPCADCDPSTASTASVSSDLHKYHVACSCGGAQYAECASVGGPPSPQPPGPAAAGKEQRPPALPPRPPPRPRPRHATQGGSTRSDPPAPSSGAVAAAPGPRKYVWWCLGMGAAACLLGGLLLAAAMLLRAHTDSLHHLETIPTPVPAAMLVATGLCIMSLARRRNRYSYLIKVVGACCLVCALTCVLVTITTTVIHMNRLQTLRKCVYTEKTRTCTCYSALTDGQNPAEDEEGVKCVFEAVVDCGTVHGALYKCLGAVFGLSVAGVLVCICSAMLAYQLLSHERKKMYWEQLELRCRSLYRPAGTGTGTGTGTTNTQGGTARPHSQQPQVCGECCAECRAAAAVSWDLQHRIWASGRVGNLYSPNPGTGRRVSPWSWFPWPRNSNQRVGGSSSGDSAYGFGANSPGGYWQLGPPPPYTPHHRYLHHHMQQMSHHHHPHSSQPNSTTTQQRRACQHAHRPTVSEDFSEELEEVHQHTCQKYQHPVPEGVEETVLQGEENLAFQCEKQSPQRQQQARSGESELYFADVSSCCNVSLKALEYCGGGIVGTMDSQGDSSSDESEGVAQAQARSHRHKHRHNINAEGMAACSQSPSRGRQRNPNNIAHQSREANRGSNARSCDNPGISGNNGCRSNIRNPNSRSDLQYSENEEEMCQNNSGNFAHCTNPECTRLQDENLIRGSEILRRISEDNGENNSGVCHLGGGGMCQNSGNFNSCSGNIDRASMRVRQSPNRSSFICRSPVNLRANCVGLPNSDEDFVGNLRRRDDPINYGGATSSLAQIRRRNLDELQEEQFNRRHTIEEEIFNAALDNACVSYKRKAIDENMLNENAIENHLTMRRQAIEDAILNNSLEMVDEATLASMRRNALEESILNCSVNQTIASLRMKDEKNEQIMKRKAIDESMLDENMSFSPIRRKNLDDSKDQNNVSMSPLRRRVLEDSLNNELNSSFASMRRKNLDDSINDSPNASSSPMRRKRMDDNNIAEQAVSLSQLRKKGREDSISSDEQNVSLTTRRKVNNEDIDQNISMSPLRRKVLDDKMNQDVINVSLTKKAIEDSMLTNEILRTKALEELISEQNNISRRGNKNIDEILNNHADSSLISKANIAQMVQNGNFTINFNSSIHESLEESLAGELGGSRRGIIEGVCLGPDLRYEPVQGFGEGMNAEESNGEAGTNNPVHLRCCSDSNTMDSGWQSGSEKHITD